MAYLTSGQIQITLKAADPQSKVAPLTFTGVKELRIDYQVNVHVRCFFKTAIGFEHEGGLDQRSAYLDLMHQKTYILVKNLGAGEVLFNGMVVQINVKLEKDAKTNQTEYFLEVNSFSHTYQMDLKQRKLTWQDPQMTLEGLLKKVCKRYSSQHLVYKIEPVKTGEQALNRFYLQYEETDWQLLRRIASQFNRVLLPNPTVEWPQFWLGIAMDENKDLTACISQMNQHVISNLAQYRPSNPDISYKKLKTDRVFKIGDQVKIENQLWTICQKIVELEAHQLVYQYVFTTEAGMKTAKLTNGKIAGISLSGKVLKCQGDRIKVHFDIDGKRSEEMECFFPYATAYAADGHTGLYCLPEEHDYVQVYFPGPDEKNGVVIAAVRKTATDQHHDPSVKYLRTKNGKELKFAAGEILITGQNNSSGKVLVWLNEQKGIVFYGQKSVKVRSGKLTTLSAKKVTLSAGGQLEAKCKDSQLTLNGELQFKDNQILKN